MHEAKSIKTLFDECGVEEPEWAQIPTGTLQSIVERILSMFCVFVLWFSSQLFAVFSPNFLYHVVPHFGLPP